MAVTDKVKKQNQKAIQRSTRSLVELTGRNRKMVYSSLRHHSREQLKGIRNAVESQVKNLSYLLSQVLKVEQLHSDLEKEQTERTASKSKGNRNQQKLATLASAHPLGRVIGRTKVVEFGSPGSSHWATPRRRGK